MDGYLSKPIDREQLQQSLSRGLNDPGENSGAAEQAAG
jgi:CheY-like chemotaxis protein